jgi:hypothetical protein
MLHTSICVECTAAHKRLELREQLLRLTLLLLLLLLLFLVSLQASNKDIVAAYTRLYQLLVTAGYESWQDYVLDQVGIHTPG